MLDEVDGANATLTDQLARVERQTIADALQASGNSLEATDESLGISRKTLYDKMRRYGLGRPSGYNDADPWPPTMFSDRGASGTSPPLRIVAFDVTSPTYHRACMDPARSTPATASARSVRLPRGI